MQNSKTKITIETWHMSFHLDRNYGTFQCNFCGKLFHHSPARMRQAVGLRTTAPSILFHCLCGHCTNRIIEPLYGYKPYK